jgi:hypothetical protein
MNPKNTILTMLKFKSQVRINRNSCLGVPRSLKEPCQDGAEKIIKKINRLKIEILQGKKTFWVKN